VKISSFSINGFGMFAQVSVTGIGPGLNVFVGDNEAGKSTLLAFFRSMLFGFLDGRSRENLYEPLAGGLHGGRLVFLHPQEGEFTLLRENGPRGGTVVLEFADGRRGGAAELARITHGMDRNAYSNVWAFGLSELQTLKTLTGDDVKGALLGAGMGAAVNAVPRARQEVKKQTDELFSKKGSKALINRRLQQLEKVEADIDEAFLQTARFKELKDESRSLDRQIEAAREEKTAAQAGLFNCERLYGLWDDWILWGEATGNLEKLGHLPKDFPRDALARFEALNADLEKVMARKKEIEALLAQHTSQLEQCRPDELLLEKEGAVFALAQQAKIHEQNLFEIEEGRNSIRAKEDSLNEILASLGPGWTAQKAAEADRSLFARQQIVFHEEQTGRASRQADLAAQAFKSAKTNFEKALSERLSLEGQLKDLPEPEKDLDEAACERLLRGQDSFVSLAVKIPALENQQEELARQLEQAARQVSASFGPDDLVSLDPSGEAQVRAVHIEKELDRSASALETAGELLEKAQIQLAARERQLEEKARLLEEQKAQGSLDSRQIEQMRDRLKEARPIAAQLAAERLDRQGSAPGSERPARLVALTWLAVGAIAAGGILSLWAMLADLGPFALVAGIALAGAGIAGLAGRRVGPGRARSARERIAALEKALAKILGEPGPFDNELISRLEDELLDAKQRLAQRQHLEEIFAQARREADGCRAELEIARKRLEKAMEQEQKAKDDWDALCATLKLPAMTPQELRLVFRRAEQAGDAAKKAREMARQIQDARAGLAAYLADAQKLGVLEGKFDSIDVNNLTCQELEALPPALELFLEKMKQAQDTARQREAAARDLNKSVMQEEQAGRALEKSRQEDEIAAIALEEARKAWDTWLEGRDLPKGLDFAGARQALEHLGDAARLKADITRLEEDRAAKRVAVAAFEKEAQDLFEALGILLDKALSLGQSVLGLNEKARQNANNAQRAGELLSQIRQREVEVAQTAAEIDDLLARKKALFAAARADNEEDFRRLCGEKGQQEHWEGIRQQAELSMKKLAGTGDLEPLRQVLSMTAKEDLALEIERQASFIKEIDRQTEESRNRKAHTEAEMNQLAGARNLSALLADREALKEEIRLLAQRWAKYAVCGFLVEEAAKSFEREHQPQVLKDAGNYFAAVTRGRYKGVLAPVGENLVEAVAADSTRKLVEALSRGTAEQLYLCLRLAYIKNGSTTGLPVIMDDVVANFDPGRAAAFAEVLWDFAKENQVLFFTCQPATAGLFAKVARQTPFFRMANQDIAPASSWPV